MLTHVSRIPESIRQRILHCQTEDNWDDEGAIGITSQACDSALRFLEVLLEHDVTLPLPKISPSVYGSVSLYWHKENSHFIVRPAPDSETAFYRYERSGCPSISDDEPQIQVANRVLNFLNATYAKQS